MTHICNNINSQVGNVPDHASLLWWNLIKFNRIKHFSLRTEVSHLGVLDQLGQVLLADPILRQDVEKDNPDLVVDGDVLIQENRNNVLHVIFDFLSLSICPHGKVLLHLTELVDVPLIVLHTLLCQVKMGGELGQLLVRDPLEIEN